MNLLKAQEFPDCAACPAGSVHRHCPVAGRPESNALWRGERLYRARDVIVREGTPITDVMLMTAGWAIAYMRGAEGQRRILDVRLPGDSISTHAVVSGRARYTLRALTDVRVCLFDSKAMRAAARREDGVSDAIETLVRGALDRLLWRIEVFSGARFAESAMATLVVDVYRRLRAASLVDGMAFDFPLTHEMVAEFLGLTKVHVSRTLRALRQEGCVEISGGRAEIRDYERLVALSGVRPFGH